MLSELEDLQESDEEIWGELTLSFTINTRSKESNEIIEREYTFGHAPPWDKWMFQEFEEKRTEDTKCMTDRNWRRTRHIMWDDISQTPTIDVPPEVGEKLNEALGTDSVTIQVPCGSIDEAKYHEETYE